MSRSLLSILFTVAAIAGIFSCKTPANLNYLQGNLDSAGYRNLRVPEPIIQKGDLLSILVHSSSREASLLYNQPMIVTGEGNVQPTGYLVDNNGNIKFQDIGTIQVAGLTKDQLAKLLESKLKDTLLTNPYFTIRFLNFKVTLIGDVNNPGVFTIPSERVSILEAMALAGDLTLYGKRENVLVIRESGEQRTFGRIDLTSPDIFSSPYFYLQQNDVVVVEAQKRKAAESNQLTARNISIATSIVSTIVLIITVFRN